jgi:hypothetical protein
MAIPSCVSLLLVSPFGESGQQDRVLNLFGIEAKLLTALIRGTGMQIAYL